MGLPAHKWHLAADYQNHTFAEVDFGDGYVAIDPDAQVFYLDYDNHTLLDKEAVDKDHYLIHRTRHFGKSSHSTFQMQNLYNGSVVKSGPSSCRGASMDVNLRPGETIIFYWQEPASYFHSILPASFSVPYPVANNKIVYDVPISSASFSELLYSYSNIILDHHPNGDPFIHPEALNLKSEFIIKIECPFILLDSQVVFKWFQATKDSRVMLDFSKDGSKWQRVWSSSQSGFQQAGINLTSCINELPAMNRHDMFLRFKLMPKSTENACGISAIKVSSTFQASRFFMPNLRLGENLITFTDANSDERNIKVDIKWQESKDNTPPEAVAKPLFPEQNGETELLQFTFKWPEPNDADGDAIVDYHFQLSERSDMAFPLSPNFDRYISAADKKIAPIFTIPWPGLLNDGEKYYWRVRALDAGGAWSNWSRTWSFVAHGVMPPIDGRIILGASKRPVIEWSANPKGARPVSYLIYGSDKAHGFIPDSINLIGKSKAADFIPSSREIKYFRVAAVDSNGSVSGPSRIIRAGASSTFQTSEVSKTSGGCRKR